MFVERNVGYAQKSPLSALFKIGGWSHVLANGALGAQSCSLASGSVEVHACSSTRETLTPSTFTPTKFEPVLCRKG